VIAIKKIIIRLLLCATVLCGILMFCEISSNNKQNSIQHEQNVNDIKGKYDSVSGNFEGKWQLTDTHSSISSTITIYNQDDNGFDFVVEANYFMHSDVIEGEAVFESPSIAKYVDKYDDESSISFRLNADVMYIEKEGCPISPGVDIEGEYTLNKPQYVNPDILETLFSKDELKSIKGMMPEEKYSEYFVFCSRNGLYDEQEITIIDGIEAKNIYVFVPTAGMGYNVFITSEGVVYLQLFDEDNSFYTNDENWELNEMPSICSAE
jgi:hypothetical protein